MDEDFISNCKLGENIWKCPFESCGKVLSRKQTLKSHIANLHNEEAGNPVKRYKQYDTTMDETTLAMPRTTKWRLQKRKEELPCSSDPDSANDTVMELSYDFMDERQSNSDGENSDIEYLISEPESEGSSTSDESDISELEFHNNEPPIYVLPPSDSVYESTINKSEHALAVSAFATRHNLSDTAIGDMLQLIQLHLPVSNIAETNTRKLKESCGFNSSYLQHHLYCGSCRKLFDTQSEQCLTPGCESTKSSSQCTDYFVSGNMEAQLQEILQRDGLWESIEESRSSITENISDIKSGKEYKKLQEPGGFLYKNQNITLSLFIDGIPLFKSSSTSLWPVYFLINEIPPKERFSRKNMILWGIWQGVGKPKMNMFLRPLITDLVKLYQTGISFRHKQSEVTIKAMLIVATMDLQARSYVLMMTMHNGEYGCLYCMEPGKVVPSGRGHCRAYLKTDQEVPARSDESLRQNSIAARQSGQKVNGMLGQSVFWFLPYFSFTKNVVIDYMHGTLLGVTKKMLELWFDKTHASEPFSITNAMSDIDKDIKNIKPLYVVHRLPRILTGTYNNWKASELRNWLIFYSLPCLKERLPNIYIIHFSCLTEAIYILLREGITNEDLRRADTLLHAYVTNVQRLYGDRFMSMNVHNLTHMTNIVSSWGPLWAWSCFCFESFNGEIKKSIHGTGNVCKQIYWTLQSQKRVEFKAKQLHEDSKVRQFMEKVMEKKSDFSENAEAFQCSVIKVVPVVDKFTEEVKSQLEQQCGSSCERDFYSVAKIARNGYLMYSKMCTKVKKQNSYTIKLLKTLDSNVEATVVEVYRYLMEITSRKVFAVCRLAVSSGSILPNRVQHLQKIVFMGDEYSTVVPVEYLGEPMMCIRSRDEVFAALLPNHFERD